ncbi:LLM class F420-dependent oxidoreductase [Ornithinimicrobium cryptoxanthini]|uniref:LLM class F420-dependent oxidoreductase n=1 Tax=Ornithinimicrobium cryptoxanthini TaxID=2934161 RepID=A0ABY4YFD7_9MICO|nr:LLM class F420-dependent oxidoreductase [Ornithinimicrobium cryptoxanthini]USQ75481.1 LLM class F420-dependent oxidoreductase [Ornithinimicrobium cryptoxanthini]
MKLGLQVSHWSWPDAPASIGPTFTRIARDAEQAGLSSLWVMDHFFQIPALGPPEAEMLEAYTTLGFAAGLTSSIELGALVTGVTYRHPGILAKTVTTLDVLSGGRAWLGLGAAWFEEEHRSLGVAYPPVTERFERLEETLQIIGQMWDGDETPYAGRHYRLARPLNSPQPVRRPRVLIGGGGERKTLRLVARYADACNLFDYSGPGVLRGKFDVLARHCADIGRDPQEIEHTVLSRLALTRDGGETMCTGEISLSVAQAVDKLGALAEIGTDTVYFAMANVTDPHAYDLVAELVEQVVDL